MNPDFRTTKIRAPRNDMSEAPSLESLPTEIATLLLLNLPDPSSLRALVRVSPLYHELYRQHRRRFLSTALFNCLSYDGLHIALSVQEASTIFSDDSDEDPIFRKQKVRQRFFEKPSSMPMSRNWLDSISFDTLISLMQYHWKIAAVACAYIQTTLSANPVTGEPIPVYPTPSRSESHRIYRALYHFEHYCVLFVSRSKIPDVPPSQDGQAPLQYGRQIALQYTENQFSLYSFLPLIASWEIEEIACIRNYVLKQYTKILQSCALELQQLEELVVEDNGFITGTRDGPFNISTPTVEDERKEYLMSLGLPFFFSIYFAPTTSSQARLIYQHPWRRVNFLSRAISAYRELERWDQSGNVYNTCIEFTSEDEGPNAALPWSRMSDPEFFYQGREFLRSWGYVLWDRSRLEGWKVLEQDPAVLLKDKETVPRIVLDRMGRPVRTGVYALY